MDYTILVLWGNASGDLGLNLGLDVLQHSLPTDAVPQDMRLIAASDVFGVAEIGKSKQILKRLWSISIILRDWMN